MAAKMLQQFEPFLEAGNVVVCQLLCLMFCWRQQFGLPLVFKQETEHVIFKIISGFQAKMEIIAGSDATTLAREYRCLHLLFCAVSSPEQRIEIIKITLVLTSHVPQELAAFIAPKLLLSMALLCPKFNAIHLASTAFNLLVATPSATCDEDSLKKMFTVFDKYNIQELCQLPAYTKLISEG